MIDTSPIYIPAQRLRGKIIHLSPDGDYTLCNWVMRDTTWQRHTERVALFTLLIAGVKLCRECERKAIAEREEASSNL